MHFLVVFLIYLTRLVDAGKYYTSRKELNETIYGKTRIAVDNFIDNHHMNIMERFLRKHKHVLFQRLDNNYKLSDLEGQFMRQLFNGGATPKCIETILPECETIAEQAITALKSGDFMPLHPSVSNYTTSQLLQAFETYVYIRNKMYEYVSELFNSTMYHAEHNHGVFYYFPPKSPVEYNIEGVDYLYSPHWDITTFATGSYDRPFQLNVKNLPLSMYRRYTAVLYFSDVPPSDGGNFQYWDLPNYDKLPPANGTESNGRYTMGVLKGENATIIRVWPKRGKLVVLSAFDLHGVPAYTGNFERWGYCIFMTDQLGEEQKRARIIPEQFRPLLEKPSLQPTRAPRRPHSSHSPHFTHSPHYSRAPHQVSPKT